VPPPGSCLVPPPPLHRPDSSPLWPEAPLLTKARSWPEGGLLPSGYKRRGGRSLLEAPHSEPGTLLSTLDPNSRPFTPAARAEPAALEEDEGDGEVEAVDVLYSGRRGEEELAWDPASLLPADLCSSPTPGSPRPARCTAAAV
jgi:hypothetical protein